MRLWGVPVVCMCDKHLLGEHVEMHMFKAVIQSGKSLAGYIRDKLVDTDRIIDRHNLLADEMARRGMKHDSPLTEISYPEGFEHRQSVDQNLSMMELARRCPDCRGILEARYGAEMFAHLPIGGDSVKSPAADFHVVTYNGQVIAEIRGKREKAVLTLERHRRKMRAC